MTANTVIPFRDLGLTPSVLQALSDVGYETPSPIQASTIPLLMEGHDVLGQAQTGTGKTAAFALPILSRLNIEKRDIQVLVLTPTRELALQVAEAFQTYAKHIKGFHVLPVYGGQDYRQQIRALNRGVHVIVGTPGRVMDHMRRGTLKLDKLETLVLDEADEMLRMGFIDDVEWVLQQSPAEKQVALFSATMPPPIKRIATQHLVDPKEIVIQVKTSTADTIRQRFWPVSGLNKLDALTRILEAEPFDAMLIFVRTKNATAELAEKLEARGYATSALNGDIAQKQRERTVENLKKGKLDILVATDVAARGLDVQRITHVINYDIPYDTEAYVHRIGRTGRAGRKGDAILFVAPREKRMLQSIERATGSKIEKMEMPSTKNINDSRIQRFKQQISETLASGNIDIYYQIIKQFQQEENVPALEIAAALACQLQGDTPFLLQTKSETKKSKSGSEKASNQSDKPKTERSKAERSKAERSKAERSKERPEKPKTDRKKPDAKKNSRSPVGSGMERFRIEVGAQHEVTAKNIVGAIANEAGLDSQFIGNIDIRDDYSIVDLPEQMPSSIFKHLKKTWVCGQQLRISRFEKKKTTDAKKPAGKRKPAKKKKSAKRDSKGKKRAARK